MQSSDNLRPPYPLVNLLPDTPSADGEPRAWACVSAGGLAAFTPPPGLATLEIAADPDEPGQHAAWTCARRLRATGLRVQVATPDRTGTDIDDLLQRRHRAVGMAYG